MAHSDDVQDPTRRDFLNTITTVVGVAGVGVASWPLISSMNPTADVRMRATTACTFRKAA